METRGGRVCTAVLVVIRRCMVIAYLCLMMFLLLLTLRLVFHGLQWRPLARPIGAANEQNNTVVNQSLIDFRWSDTRAVAHNGLQDALTRVNTGSKKERAEGYLLRIVALTGAAPMGNGYILDVGATRFHVREGPVGQLGDLNDSKCTYKETCFYSPRRDMRKAEQIATALLQLARNPSLFGKWAAQDGLMIKADGKVFARVR
jgi:hypothetical protein